MMQGEAYIIVELLWEPTTALILSSDILFLAVAHSRN